MSIKIYNSLSKSKENFTPLEEGKVKMYVCGPTVYDLLHVGNFRGAIFFNIVRNWLEHSKYKVTFVYNCTDIDDKIINKAKEQGISIQEISAKYLKEFETDFQALNLTEHDHNPKATDFIDDMVKVIQTLIDKGFAYHVNGEVLYEIDRFKGYGTLSRENCDDLQAGHRVDTTAHKKSPFDFVLWKPSKEDEPGWDSPWGRGRPGWHLECSTMINTILGDRIDIHGGGIDLLFPHHENEIAQSEGVTGAKPFVRYWMHNNFIKFGDEKMSKSLGNVIKARDFMDKYHPEILKFLILSVHYRSFLSMGQEQVHQSMAGLARVYSALRMADEALASGVGETLLDEEFKKIFESETAKVNNGFNDDFNTPVIFAGIFEVVRAFNASFGKKGKITDQIKSRAAAFKQWMSNYTGILSLFNESPKIFLKELDHILIKEKGLDAEEIESLIRQRAGARNNKDFKTSDGIRDRLTAMDVILHDTNDATTWEVRKG